MADTFTKGYVTGDLEKRINKLNTRKEALEGYIAKKGNSVSSKRIIELEKINNLLKSYDQALEFIENTNGSYIFHGEASTLGDRYIKGKKDKIDYIKTKKKPYEYDLMNNFKQNYKYKKKIDKLKKKSGRIEKHQRRIANLRYWRKLWGYKKQAYQQAHIDAKTAVDRHFKEQVRDYRRMERQAIRNDKILARGYANHKKANSYLKKGVLDAYLSVLKLKDFIPVGLIKVSDAIKDKIGLPTHSYDPSVPARVR